MFFPKAMTEIELIVPAKDLEAVTKVLGSRGNFQQVESTYLGLENLGPSTWLEKAANYSTLERRIQVIAQNLNLSEEYSGSSNSDSKADFDAMQAGVDRIEEGVKAAVDEMSVEKKKLEQLEGQLQQLQPIADLNYEIGALRNSKYLYSIAGVIASDQLDRLESNPGLARIPYYVHILRDDPKKPLVWFFGPRSNSDVMDRAARSAFLTPVNLPEEFDGSPAEIVKELSKSIDASNHKISELERVLAKLSNTHKKELYELWREVHANRVMADAIARFGQLRHTYIVVGWVPVAELESLTERLKKASKEILIEVIPVERLGQNANVPVALQNPGFLAAVEMVVNTYARPRYNELDPTILIAITFPLLYGAMYGDVGHGFVLALMGVMMKVVPSWRSLSSFGNLVIACGTIGMIFGFLFGSVFGFEEVLPHHPFFGQFFWLSPIHNTQTILVVAIGAGIVILLVGYILNLFNAARTRNWGRFFFDTNGLAGLILYLSFLVVLGQAAANMFTGKPIFPTSLITISQILILPGLLLAVVFSHPLQHWVEEGHFLIEGGWVIFLVQSGAEVLEKFISMFSNTLSYMRVGAFAIVHAGLLSAVFIIANLASQGEATGVGYWAVIVLGNLFVIGLEGFIVAIQTMRLHYYEFFSKFFMGGGSEYQPLILATAEKK